MHLVQKKREQMFSVVYPIKLWQFRWNLVGCFLNKFAAKWCKRFPPHHVSKLPCETWNAHCTRATIELLQKETPEFIPPQLCPPTLPDLNPVDNSMWEILQEMVYKHTLLICSYQRLHWWMAAWHTPCSVTISVRSAHFKFHKVV